MSLRITAVPLFFVLLVAGGAFGQDAPKNDEKKPLKEQIIITEETFKLEVAADDKTRAKGLMGREKIDEHGGSRPDVVLGSRAGSQL